MSIEHQVAGKVAVTFNSQALGYSRDGVTIRIDAAFLDVPSDDYGGTSGRPSDRQILGAEANIICELTKYDSALVHALTSYDPSGAAGVLPAIGTLMRQDGKTATLLLNGDNEDWTFATAYLIGSQETNKGSRYSTFVLSFVGVINNTTSRTLFTVA